MTTEYPLHDRVKEVQADSQTISGFLEWLFRQGYWIGTWEAPQPGWVEVPCVMHSNIEKWLAEYFGIDLEAFHTEKEQMVQKLRELNT